MPFQIVHQRKDALLKAINTSGSFTNMLESYMPTLNSKGLLGLALIRAAAKPDGIDLG